MMRVLPVPGGPWISVMGCFSSAARSAVSCDSAIQDSESEREMKSSSDEVSDEPSRSPSRT
jgi:hypothetical protein